MLRVLARNQSARRTSHREISALQQVAMVEGGAAALKRYAVREWRTPQYDILPL